MAAEILAFFFSWGLGVSGGDSLSVFVLFLAGVCGPEALLDAGVVDVANEVFPSLGQCRPVRLGVSLPIQIGRGSAPFGVSFQARWS